MATFKITEKQKNAMKLISQMLEEISQINQLLKLRDYTVGSMEDKKLRYTLDPTQRELITTLLLSRKKLHTRKIHSLARENRIELDDQELSIMEEAETAVPAEY